MAKILISGLINHETTLQVDGFPIEYTPVSYPFWGISSSISGVGFNIAKALSTLGDEICLFSLMGDDFLGDLIFRELDRNQLSTTFIQRILSRTPQSVILYDSMGNRSIHVDLKDVQAHRYLGDDFERVLPGIDLAVLCNINFSREFIPIIKRNNILMATDVHAIADIHDEYNQEFMEAADILFLSHERLPTTPELFAEQVVHKFRNEIVVIGLGEQGALMAVPRDRFLGRFPAVFTRPIVNTIGAGDALFSAFIHRYLEGFNPYLAIKEALVFASYKIGESGGASGFLDDHSLKSWSDKLFV